MAYTLDTKVDELLKDSHAVEVLEKHIPGISKEPVVGMVSEMRSSHCLPCHRPSNTGSPKKRL